MVRHPALSWPRHRWPPAAYSTRHNRKQMASDNTRAAPANSARDARSARRKMDHHHAHTGRHNQTKTIEPATIWAPPRSAWPRTAPRSIHAQNVMIKRGNSGTVGARTSVATIHAKVRRHAGDKHHDPSLTRPGRTAVKCTLRDAAPATAAPALGRYHPTP